MSNSERDESHSGTTWEAHGQDSGLGVVAGGSASSYYERTTPKVSRLGRTGPPLPGTVKTTDPRIPGQSWTQKPNSRNLESAHQARGGVP
jgi:hypothetical protein